MALREIHMRLKAPFETNFGIVQNRRILLVETIVDGDSGWGRSRSETPGYNAETTETAWRVLSDFIAPSVIGKNILDGCEFPALMSHIRGHEMAINIKLGGRWRAYRSALRRRKSAATIPSRSGAGGCWNPVLEEPTTSRCQRSKGFTLLATFQPVNAIGTRTLSSPTSRSHRRARSMFPKYHVWHI